MISVDEALRVVLEHTAVLGPVGVDLLDSLGLVLAEDVASDMDMPPFDKSAMDGYAVLAEDTRQATPEHPVILDVIEEVQAGRLPCLPISSGHATRIMTGAPIPEGADAVVMVEDTSPVDGADKVKILRSVRSGRSVCYRGEDITRGQVVIRAGTVLRPQDIGTAASVGRTVLQVHRRPEVAVMATGSEIVEPGCAPAPGKIRNSNGSSMSAQALQAGARVTYLGIADDTTPDLRVKIEEGLSGDILMLSGGVSMGTYDLVKETLTACGVAILFDAVNIKPGKPVTFGIAQSGQLVFALPGNPVSTFVTFELLVRPAIRKMLGMRELSRPVVAATLDSDFERRSPDRRQYEGAETHYDGAAWHTHPAGSHGSADLLSATRANSLMVIPEGTTRLRTGDTVSVHLIEIAFIGESGI